MEIITGRIVDIKPDGTVTITATLPDLMRACIRQYGDVQIGLADGRTISPEQRRKAYALMGEIAAWSGFSAEETKLVMKRQFVDQHLQSLQKLLFSLSNCDVTTAREFIGYLIDFILEFDVPTRVPLATLCDDVARYVYACLIHKKCAVCGAKAELHHVERVGAGRNRRDICHIGMEALPLCADHHRLGPDAAHTIGDAALMDKFHLEAVAIDERIAKVYRLNTKEG